MTNINKAKLTVKIKSLAAESRILKDETKKSMRNNIDGTYELQNHMMHVVNPELRATGLAIAYMKGQNYKDVEHKRKPEKEACFWEYTVKVLYRILKKYHDKDLTKDTLTEWLGGNNTWYRF